MTYSIPIRAGLKQRLAEFKAVLNRFPEGDIELSAGRAGTKDGVASRPGDDVQEADPIPRMAPDGTAAAGVDDGRSPEK